MARYTFLVMINPAEGQDDTLNAWLDDVHLKETLETEGFISVKRFELAPEEANNPRAKHRYMHMYEVETDNLAETMKALAAAGPTRTPPPPALKVSDMQLGFYKAR